LWPTPLPAQPGLVQRALLVLRIISIFFGRRALYPHHSMSDFAKLYCLTEYRVVLNTPPILAPTLSPQSRPLVSYPNCRLSLSCQKSIDQLPPALLVLFTPTLEACYPAAGGPQELTCPRPPPQRMVNFPGPRRAGFWPSCSLLVMYNITQSMSEPD